MSLRLRILLASVVLGLLSGCGSPQEREARAIKRGDDYFAAQKWDKARIEYRNALQLVPNDGVARLRNGLVLEKLGKPTEAVQFLIGALEVMPDSIETREHLGRLLVLGGLTQRAFDVAADGLAKHPQAAGLLTVRAAAQARLGHPSEARVDAEAALKIDPNNEFTIAVLAGLYKAENQTARARQVLEAGVRALPSNVDLRVALADLDISSGDSAKGEQELQEIVRLNPGQKAPRLRLAHLQADRHETDAAQRSLEEAVRALPDDAEVEASYVEFLNVYKGPGAAEAELQKQVTAHPDDPDRRLSLATFYLQGKDLTKAEATLREVVKRQGNAAAGLLAKSRLATVRAAAGDTKDAQKLISEVLEKSPHDADALLLRGNLSLASGDAKRAIEDLRAVSRDLPTSQPVLRTLARAYRLNGEAGLAEEVLRHAAELDPSDAATRIDLVTFLQQSGRAGEAVPALRELLQQKPKDANAQVAAFRGALAANDIGFARDVVEVVRREDAQPSHAHLLAGMLEEAQKHPDRAVAEYRSALSFEPTMQDALTRAVAVLVVSKQAAAAIKLLDEVSAKAPSYPLPNSLKGDILLDQKDYSGADQAYRSALDRAPHWWLGSRGVANTMIRRGDTAGAVKFLKEAAEHADERWRVLVDLAQAEQLDGHSDDAIATYEQAYGLEKNTGTANNLANLLLERHRTAADLNRALELSQSFAGSDSPIFAGTYGWAKFKSGDLAAALPALKRAVAGAPNSSVAHYRLGAALAAAGDRAGALQSLRIAVRGEQTYPGANEAAALLQQLSTAK